MLEEFKLLQRLMGLNPQGGFENIVVRFILWIVIFTCDVSFLIYLILNVRNDTYRALAVLPGTVGFAINMMTYSHLVLCRNRFDSLLDELQGIVNESTKLNWIILNNWTKSWLSS